MNKIRLPLRSHGSPHEQTETIPVQEIAIVIVDMWSYHWCKTWVGRACAMIPRMNRALECARALGVQIIHAPTDVSNFYAGWPQRERMAALPFVAPASGVNLYDWPSESMIESVSPIPYWEGEMCGGPIDCIPNYGEMRLHEELVIGEGDWIAASGQDIYNLCARDGIQTLLYLGGATNICLVRKPEGMINLRAAGLRCIVARDLTEAHSTGLDSHALDVNTQVAVAHIEQHIGYSTDFTRALDEMGLWREDECGRVLIKPWGRANYPQCFEREIKVTMSYPPMPDAELRYTKDGQAPEANSARYEDALSFTESAVLKVAAFREGKRISGVSESVYLRLPPIPPCPSTHLSDLTPRWATVKAHLPWWNHPAQGTLPPPARDKSYDGTPLMLRGIVYERGVGVSSPSQMVFDLKPEYTRFVAQAGVCESLLSHDLGREIASGARVRFQVFLDGELAAESMLMSISETPWRFDVPIPSGTRTISLVTTTPDPAGSHNLGNWVNAGFA